MGRAEVEPAGELGPGEGAEDAGEGDDDVDEGEGGGFHLELGFGEEDGGAADGGDAVAEEEPGAEEEDDVFEVAGTHHCSAEGAPRVDDVACPAWLFGTGEGERRAGTGSEPERGWDGEYEPPCAYDEEDETEGERGRACHHDEEDGEGLDENGGSVAYTNAVGRYLGRELEFGRGRVGFGIYTFEIGQESRGGFA